MPGLFGDLGPVLMLRHAVALPCVAGDVVRPFHARLKDHAADGLFSGRNQNASQIQPRAQIRANPDHTSALGFCLRRWYLNDTMSEQNIFFPESQRNASADRTPAK